MIDQLYLSVLDFLILLSNHWKIIAIIIIIGIGTLLMFLTLKAPKPVKIASVSTNTVKQRKQVPAPTLTTEQSSEPIKRAKMPPIHIGNLKVQDNHVSNVDMPSSPKENAPITPIFIKPISYDLEVIKEKTIYFLSKVEPKGTEFKRVKAYTWSCIKNNESNDGSPKDFETAVRQVLNTLKKEKIIKYSSKRKIWKFVPENHPVTLHKLTPKEQAYFRGKGLGAGWFRLDNRKSGLEAIWWIHKNFNPDEFEKFCCAVLAHHNVQNVKVSEKRASGADGGIDGLGRYQIDEETVDVAIQAKRYKPDRYADTTELDSLVGALTKHDIDYGFLITTSMISDRAKDEADKITSNDRNNIQLQLIDQNKLIECMEYRADSPHGYGLHKTDEKGWYYLNPTMLKKAISNY